MAISWTIIVLGALLQGMQCNADGSTTALPVSTLPTKADTTTADSTKATVPLTSSSSTKPTTSSASVDYTTLTTPPASSEPTKPASSSPYLESTKLTTLGPNKSAIPSSSPDSSTQAPTTEATSPDQTVSSSTVAKQDQATTVITTNPNQGTTNLNRPATTTSTEDANTQLSSTQTNPSAVAKNHKLPTTAAPDSKSTASQSLGTTKAQTTTVLIIPGLRNENITTSTSAPQKSFNHFYDLSSSTERNIVYDACKMLGQKMKGNCSVTVKFHDKQIIVTITINADQKIPLENYKSLESVSGVTDNTTLQKEEVKGTIPDTLIAILASCGALVLILCCFAAYCTYHRRSYRKNQQQHLTEELQTVENGYHDNPTLEVMEIQPEMQEKKLTLNGEFNDSWIVPIDNLLKEDIPDEEDTHL